MNLILLEPHEVDPTGRAILRGRRFDHLRQVLDVTEGRELRVGLIDGPLGRAIVARIAPDSLELDCAFATPTVPRPADTLLLAIPRPKILARVCEHASALGFARIVLFRSWRVDKSHLQSRVLDPDTLREHLCLGLEQGRHTRLPSVVVCERFRPFVEDRLDSVLPADALRFVCDGDAAVTMATVRPAKDRPFAVAIGPERGFTSFEVDLLAAHGFVAVRLPTGTLRVETAVAVAHAQLTLLRELAATP